MNDLADAREVYREAWKKGRGSYYQALFQGRSGNLATLDRIMEHVPFTTEQTVGLEEVPLRKIIGTVSYSRARSFSCDWLPLMKPRSEFSQKWAALYLHHMREGISEPVILHEYLNWYWVAEGNKRISVLSWLGAAKVEAQVVRLLPPRDPADAQTAVYYRFLDFKQRTGIGELWLRYPDGYDRLQEQLRRGLGTEAGEEQYRLFRNRIYLPFRRIFKEAGGDALDLTTGEAFLRCCELFGWPADPESDLWRTRIAGLVRELSAAGGQHPVTGEIESGEPGFWGEVGNLILPAPVRRVVFVHYADPGISEWSRLHDEGRLFLEEQLGDRISTSAFNVVGGPAEREAALRAAAREADILFATAAVLYPEALKVAVEYPAIRWFVASRARSGPHLRTYSPRIHDLLYLAGLAAGALSPTPVAGYVDNNYTSYAHAAINAYALGVRAVNPEATVRVLWSYRWDEPRYARNCARFLVDEGAGIVFQNSMPRPAEASREYGLYRIEADGSAIQYARLIYDWREFYLTIVENILNRSSGGFAPDGGRRDGFTSFWGGIRTGIVRLSLERENIPSPTLRLIDGLQTLMQLGEFNPFAGPVRDQEGRMRIAAGEQPGFGEIIGMDWLVEGIAGPVLQADRIVTE